MVGGRTLEYHTPVVGSRDTDKDQVGRSMSLCEGVVGGNTKACNSVGVEGAEGGSDSSEGSVGLSWAAPCAPLGVIWCDVILYTTLYVVTL